MLIISVMGTDESSEKCEARTGGTSTTGKSSTKSLLRLLWLLKLVTVIIVHTQEWTMLSSNKRQ